MSVIVLFTYLGEKVQFSQDIKLEDFPWDIDKDYLQLVKPNGYFRTYLRSALTRPAVEFSFSYEVKFSDGGTEVAGKTVGITTANLLEDDYGRPELHDFFLNVEDLHSFDFDTAT